MMDEQTFRKNLQDLYDRHGQEDTESKLILCRIFHQQHNPDTDPPLSEYLASRLQEYYTFHLS